MAGQTRKLSDLRRDAVGMVLPAFKPKTIDGKPFDSKSLTGNVVVLHFWKYRDEPLSEPYGQVAYLDFLADRNAKKPVRVVGINIDTR